MTLLLASLSGTLLGWLMGFLSLFLILLVLVQRGRGGGLTGALGGPGGQSAFGSKAGDTFTVITVVVAAVWGFTCAFTMWLLGTHPPSAVADRPAVTAGPGDDEEDPQVPGDMSDLVVPTEQAEGEADADDANGGGNLVPTDQLDTLTAPQNQPETEAPETEATPEEGETGAEGTDPAEDTADSEEGAAGTNGSEGGDPDSPLEDEGSEPQPQP